MKFYKLFVQKVLLVTTIITMVSQSVNMKYVKRLKQILGLAVLLATIGFYIFYWQSHPALANQLRHLQPWLVVRLVLLYSCIILTLVAVFDTTLRLCGKRIPLKEHTLLTVYSAIVNFFGPLQSGPGFRSIYLKKKHRVSLKRYGAMTLFYYAFFAVFSGLFVLSGDLLLFILAILVGLIVTSSAFWYASRRWPDQVAHLTTPAIRRLLIQLAAATLLQVIFTTLIYYSELKSLNSHIGLHQAVIYTGAANFALFVSITPGALGFRESFLIFANHLHHINTQTILAANVIDRSVYIAFLGLLFVGTLVVHAKSRLSLKNDA